MRYDKGTKTLTIPQQHLEAWINAQERQGEFLVFLGMSPDVYEEGKKDLEGLRVKIEENPAFAAQVEAAAESGQGYRLPSKAVEGGNFIITKEGLVVASEQEEEET